jgi:uncharacterized protein
MGLAELLARCTGFEWDEGNLTKNWVRHEVTASECEQIFFNHPLVATQDEKHSDQENRYFALGQTDAGRLLFVVFTIRNNLIRVISARAMNRKERKVYESS